MMQHRSDNRFEARKRIALAQRTFSQHRKYLLRNSALSLNRRRELFNSLVMSRLCYGAESWTLNDQESKDYVRGALVRLFRRLLLQDRQIHMTDDEILAEVGINSPSEVLRLARLRYIGTLYHCHAVVPWGLLNLDLQWLVILEDDFRWMWRQIDQTCHLPDPDWHFGAWQNVIMHHRSYCKRLVRRAGEHACRQRRNDQLVLRFHKQFLNVIREVQPAVEQALGEQPEQDHPMPDQAIHACMSCQVCFRSRAGLGAHNFRKHRQVSSVRSLFDSTSCGACLKEYHICQVEESSASSSPLQAYPTWQATPFRSYARCWFH